jgi:hypothetical protein
MSIFLILLNLFM